jgi:putative membrane protein
MPFGGFHFEVEGHLHGRKERSDESTPMLTLYWPSLSAAILAAHVLANVVWIGALLSETLLLGRVTSLSEPTEAGVLARRVHTRLAIPAFLGSLAAGVARLWPARHLYAAMPWMYAKLAFAVAVIVLHHLIGARARRVANGAVGAAQGTWTLGWLAFLAAAGAVLFAIAKSTP